MAVCLSHWQRLMDAGLLAQRVVWLVKCEGSYTSDRFRPSQPQDQLLRYVGTDTHPHKHKHSPTYTQISSPWDMSGMALCHTGHQPFKDSLWTTPHNSLLEVLQQTADGGGHSQRICGLVLGCLVRAWERGKQKQTAPGINSSSNMTSFHFRRVTTWKPAPHPAIMILSDDGTQL